AVLELQQFVRKVQCRQYRDTIERRHLVVAADLAHACIEQMRRGHQAFASFRIDADGEFAVEDLYADRVAHALFSSDLRRVIMASTRERASSFLLSSCARSAASCSWPWRRLRFSSASRRTSSSSLSRRADICWTWDRASFGSMAT